MTNREQNYVCLLFFIFSGFLFAQEPDVISDARFKGNFGARFTLGGVEQVVTDGSPEGETNYRARLYICANDLVLAGTNQFKLFSGEDNSSVAHFELFIVRTNPTTSAFIQARLDNGTTQSSPPVALKRGWQALEINWRAGDTTGALTLLQDGVQVAQLEDLDNDEASVDKVSLGAIGVTGSGNNGFFDIDDFISRKKSNPGLACLVEAELLGFVADWPQRDLLEQMDLHAKSCNNESL